MKKPPKIALLTLHSAISTQAINGFIERHHDQIGLVIVSNPMSPRRGGSIGQFIGLCRHSGLKFSLFLAYSFFLFPLILAAGYLITRLTGGKVVDLSVKEQCKLYNIPYRSSDNINSIPIHRLLEEHAIDLAVTCFFDQILDNNFVKVPRRACLNVHPGILPPCRGLFPEIHTAAGKYTDFGVTIHLIEDAGIDTGRILLTRSVKADGMKSLLAIGRKILVEGLTALEEILPDIDTYLASARVQDDGIYYSYPDREDIRKLEEAGYSLW